MTTAVKQNPLNQQTNYVFNYQPTLLFAIPRTVNRQLIGITDQLPFKGVDIWNAYEISWLNEKGKPQLAIGEFILPIDSPYLIESKSLKLYLNSFNDTKFPSVLAVEETIKKDLSKYAEADVLVRLRSVDTHPTYQTNFPGICIDELDVECSTYQVNPGLLKFGTKKVKQQLYSNLMKSNCPITGQPDWASVFIDYEGKQIDHAALLQYLISMRSHAEYHEQCAERIFADIFSRSNPDHLTVYLRYTRRGGLDINPFRSTDTSVPTINYRLARQ